MLPDFWHGGNNSEVLRNKSIMARHAVQEERRVFATLIRRTREKEAAVALRQAQRMQTLIALTREDTNAL